jgi:hypothetical protein
VGFGLLYKLIPLLSVSRQLLPILDLEHFHIFERILSIHLFLGISAGLFPNGFQLVSSGPVTTFTITCRGTWPSASVMQSKLRSIFI